MKLSIRFFIGIVLTIGFSGTLSLASASQPTRSASGPSPEIPAYLNKSTEHSFLLKWPRGSLIFPESNDPNKTEEVFLLSEAFTSQPELQSLYYHLGSQLFSRKKYSEAKVEYLKALKFEHPSPAIYKNLGLIYFNTKSYRNAEKAYRKALQLDPEYTTAIAKLALSLAAQKKYSSAERKFKQEIRAEPTNADHHLNLGHFYYYLKKNYRGAKSSYRRALKLDPGLAKARKNLKEINRKFKKWKNQESDFENSWASDYDYDSTKKPNNPQGIPGYPEEADVTDTWDNENSPHPLF